MRMSSLTCLKQKLQPFFPPLEQVQSVNLRAALLRCLEQAKKNGVLGRDTILRKTMLDECRGERLEEVLAIFSSAVLKKVATEEQLNSKAYPSLAQTLALENRGYTGERTDLSSLIIAHNASLKKKLDRKKGSRAQYNHFAQLLDSKEQDITSRRDQTNAKAHQSKIPKLSDASKQEIRRAVRTNWTGNEQWMEALLYGDTRSQKDGVLTAPFDRVWRRVRSDRLDELEDTSGGLLEQLDNRVRAQQARLDKWQSFRKEMFSDVGDQPKEKAAGRVGPQRGIDLGFGAHEGLHLGRISPKKLNSTKKAQLTHDYRALVDGLETELNKSNGQAVPKFDLQRRREQPLKSSIQSSSSEKPAEETVSELSELEEELAKTTLPLRSKPAEVSSQGRGDTEDAMDLDTDLRPSQKAPRPRLPQPLKTMQAFRPKTVPTEISPTEPSKPQMPSSRRSPTQENKVARSPIRPSRLSPSPSPTRSPVRVGSPEMTQSPVDIPPSPTQQQADQILASMNAASPSPVKQQQRPRHTLSLAERTRLSMARGSSVDLDDDDEVALASPSRPRRRNTSSRSPTKGSTSKPGTPTTPIPEGSTAKAQRDGGGDAEEDDIVSRTRKSMANFEATQQRVRLEKEKTARREARKKSMSNKSGEIARQAYFPSVGDTVDEEDGGGEGDSTAMLEELIAREAEMGSAGVDYDSVFRSRPRIKASPPGTPAGKRLGFE